MVAINTDKSVKRLKGFERPIEPLWLRAVKVGRIVPEAIITPFDTEDDLLELMKKHGAEIVFKGAEYLDKPVTCLPGMSVQLISMLPDYSTTLQVQRGIRSGL